MHHTNIVPIFYVGLEHGVNFYAMEFIQGQSLADVLAERAEPIDPMTAMKWGVQVADALAHAHQRGVIHRDIKPSNLLLDQEGRIWLTDFGLALRMDNVALSMTGTVIGTPRYMSPEQASASRDRLDHRTDLYSLGATLYELMTGQPVYLAETPQGVIDQILNQEPVPPRSLASALSRDMETILLKCLAKQPEQRYDSAQTLADDCRAVLDGRPIKARRASWIERGTQWTRKHRSALKSTARSVAATAALLLVVLFLTQAYRQSQLIPVSFVTDTPPLAAVIRDSGGRLVARQTVPTQQPIEIAAGEYQVQVSGESRLSETYSVNLLRGQSPRFDVKLDESLLIPPLDVPSTYKLVAADGQTLIVMMDESGLQCFDPQQNRLRWTTPLEKTAQPLLKPSTGWVWPWKRLMSSSPYTGWGSFDLTPFIVNPAVDLNGDAIDDFILAARHQAIVLAISGSDGVLLWVSARGHDLQQEIGNDWERNDQGVLSGVLYSPTAVGDVNEDGVTDFTVMIAEQDKAASQVRRWLETVCGRSGKTIWRSDFNEPDFVTPATLDVPENYRWFVGSAAATTTTGGLQSDFSVNGIRRELPRLERTGYFHHVPSPPLLASWGKSTTASPKRLTMMVGSRLVAYDSATGTAIGQPIDCGVQPSRAPIVIDVDGDGADEVILTQSLSAGAASAAGTPKSRARITVWSLVDARLLWTCDLQSELPVADWSHTAIAPPSWPLVVDLDNDGRSELIFPSGTSKADRSSVRAWGEIEVRDATTGTLRWKRKLKTMDEQLDHFLTGGDIDNDGVSDVFVATLWSRAFDLYVDAFSGRDGTRLWVRQHPLNERNETVRYRLGPPLWWKTGSDGWPQFMVPVHPMQGDQKTSLAVAFSSGTGKVTRVGANLSEFQTAAGPQGTAEDLFAFVPQQRTSLDAGGKLIGFRGQARELWNRLGERWSATVDLNHDGVRDLTRVWPDGTVQAASGRDGRVLWKTQLPESDLHYLRVIAAIPRQHGSLGAGFLADDYRLHQPADDSENPRTALGDFDRDGTTDLLVYVSNLAKPNPSVPLFALSGQTGRRIWAADFRARFVSGVHAIDVRDLDGDGTAEVIFVAASDRNYPDDRDFNSHQKQLGLFVFSGRTGRLRWHEPLSKRYGLTPADSVSPMELNQGMVPLCIDDLNADGILDVIVPGEAALTAAESDQGIARNELRVLDGKTGARLWQTAYPPARNPERALSETPPATVIDFEDDKSPELITLYFVTPPGEQRSIAILKVHAASDGQELWARQFEVAAECGQIHMSDNEYRYRPQVLPLRTTEGPQRLCLHLFDGTPRVIVLDHRGQTVSDFRMDAPRGVLSGRSRVLVCDTDGDNKDEIVLIDQNHLMAIRPESPELPLWKRDLITTSDDQLEGILPACQSHPNQILLHHLFSPGTLYSLNAATGELAWTLSIPPSKPGVHPLLTDPGQLALLSDTGRDHPPWLAMQNQLSASVREATMVQQIGQNAPIPTRVMASLNSTIPVPRESNPLPWSPRPTELAPLPAAIAWAVLYSVMLFYIPGVYLVRSIQLRQWSLRWLLLSPLVATAPLLATLIDAPGLNNTNLVTKALLGLATLPAVVASVHLIRWLVLKRWWPLASWLMASVIISAVIATLAIIVTQYASPFAIEQEEYYASDKWWFIWFYGAYLTAALLTGWIVVMAMVHLIKSAMQRVQRT
ncbi:protein kinase [Novipirellula sp.]|uniref:serine/threonine-protein kinase n=1 Tax=Novipirellula sp. TaxID=2795430 RepID=UPI003563E420